MDQVGNVIPFKREGGEVVSGSDQGIDRPGSSGMEFDQEQRNAIDLCTNVNATNRIVAITGAAGTGKTTIIKETYRNLIEQGHDVAVCAPTGKAARRIKEATGIDAVTIHRLLEFPKPGERGEDGKPLSPNFPKRRKTHPLDNDVIIVDEFAMVNQELNKFLVDAMKSGCVLRVFGDNNQLAPIEERTYGHKDLQLSPFQYYLKHFPSVTLTHVYRQAEGSGVLDNASRIVRGYVPRPTPDFLIKISDRPPTTVEELVLREGDKFATSSAQIISVQNKGWIGTYELNQRIQAILNPDPLKSLDPPRHKWQEKKPITVGLGDKIVCTENMYDLRDHYERYGQYNDDGSPVAMSYIECPDNKTILNGEVGKVVDIVQGRDGLVEYIDVDVGDRHVQIPFMIQEYGFRKNDIYPVFPLKGIDLGYVLTTHKCQGSEYDEVVYVLNKSTKFMQNRRNFYTAVTRARKKVMLITDSASLSYSVWRKE